MANDRVTKVAAQPIYARSTARVTAVRMQVVIVLSFGLSFGNEFR